MKFLLVEILIWLIAASVLGLVVGWLLKSIFASRRLAAVTNDWQTQYADLSSSSASEIASLEQSVESLAGEKSTLQSKVSSLSAMVKSVETALLKSTAENKALSATVSSQQLTINEIRVESENLIKKQSEMQMELNALEKSREEEQGTLNRQMGDSTAQAADAEAPNGQPNREQKTGLETGDQEPDTVPRPGLSRLAPVLSNTLDSESTDIDEKIRSLNEQRDRLNREREELFNQEQHFAAQLTRGDDTEAYLDQTIRIEEDLTSGAQSDTSELQKAAAEPADINDGTNQTLSNRNTADDVPAKPKSLWDKFRSSVNRPVE